MTQQPAAASLELLLPIIATHRREADKNRQLSAQVVDAVCDSGLLGMPISPAHGGLGTTLPDMLQVYEAIAYEDAAVSWVIWNAGLIGFYARFMPELLREELFSGGDKLICQSTIPSGELETQDNETTIRGRWPLMSGSPGADWAVLSCRRIVNGKPVVDASGSPELVLAAIPRESYKIIDTWHSSGLRGTGSNDIEVPDTVIPAHRTFSIADESLQTGPTDRLPIFSCVSAIFAAQTLGVSRAVFDHALDRGRSSVSPGPIPDPRDRQDYQIAIAQHGEALTIARERLQSAAQAVWSHAETGDSPSPELSTDLYAAVFFAIQTAKTAVDTLHGLSGTSGLYEDSPIEKPARDLHAMLRHIVAQPAMQADVGRVRLGLDPEWPLFFV
ncbi:MAG: acyl-CoA dehydrogenase family protein [Woeseiaceae bacterium]|nr:acyl-CoA dehydrogenase family protein [Woeseiaceae bacterium]